jgi:hypothetical protein
LITAVPSAAAAESLSDVFRSRYGRRRASKRDERWLVGANDENPHCPPYLLGSADELRQELHGEVDALEPYSTRHDPHESLMRPGPFGEQRAGRDCSRNAPRGERPRHVKGNAPAG